jgi:hypothetical protein
VIFLILFLVSQSDWWPVHLSRDVKVEEEIFLVYDSNPFKYSPSDLKEFEKGYRSYRFPIRTSDDLSLKFNFNFKGERYFKWNLGLRGKIYLINGEKSFFRFSLNIEKKPFHFNYVYIPRYLIRYYPDPDSGIHIYLPCFYEEHRILIGLDIFSTGIYLGGGYRDYVDNFNEYDGKFLRAKMILPPLRLLGNAFTFSYTMENYIAEAKDEPSEDPLTSDDPDISNTKHSVELIFNRKTSIFIRDLGLKIKYRFRIFFYTTEKSFTQDPYHSGRVDRDHRITCSFNLKINKRLSFLSGIYYIWRNVTSDALPIIDEVKNYKRFQIYCGAKLTI